VRTRPASEAKTWGCVEEWGYTKFTRVRHCFRVQPHHLKPNAKVSGKR